MKKLLILWVFLFFTSCFSQNTLPEEDQQELSEEQEITSSTGEELSGTEVTIPPHEKTTSVEVEFSQDLNDLLKLLDEPQENE